MINKLEENKEYLQAKKEHDKMLSKLGQGKKDLFDLKSRFEKLDNKGIDKDWKEIEKIKKEYIGLKEHVAKLQEEAKSFSKYQEIQQQVKPEAIKCGLEINKKIVKALKELEQCKKDYLLLMSSWRGYMALRSRKVLDHQVEGITGPYCGDNIFHEATIRNFINSSEKYQKNIKADEQGKI